MKGVGVVRFSLPGVGGCRYMAETTPFRCSPKSRPDKPLLLPFLHHVGFPCYPTTPPMLGFFTDKQGELEVLEGKARGCSVGRVVEEPMKLPVSVLVWEGSAGPVTASLHVLREFKNFPCAFVMRDGSVLNVPYGVLS